MTFDELVQEVYMITSRPDLATETKSYVRAATLKAHRSDFFSKDIYETGVEFDDSLLLQSFDYPALINNFRAFKYVRRVDSATDSNTSNFFEIISPEEVIDAYGCMRVNVAYVAGRVLELRSSVAFQYMLLGAYVDPIVTENNYSSWIALQQPFAIIHEAARRVLISIGLMEEANGQQRLAAEEYAELKISAVTDVGS